jgi:hypothetical protein
MNTKQLSIAIIGVIFGFTIQACVSEQLPGPTALATNTATVTLVPTQDKVIVGLSFPGPHERWKKEEIHMSALLEEKGYEVRDHRQSRWLSV